VKTTEERFWEKVNKTDTCWLWTGCRTTNGGYARFVFDGKAGRAHRYAYALLVGPIPDGKVLDHLCRVKHCVNPAHLDPVTDVENLTRSPLTLISINAAKTHCKRGHEFTPENTYIERGGGRSCRTCKRIRSRITEPIRRARRRALAAAS
jgi:hypothetical protein